MAATVTVPCDAGENEVTVRLLPTSLASTEDPARVVLAGVVALSLAAVGFTVSATVAVLVCPAPSIAV